MALIEIPTKVMLDAILDELQLPKSTCKTTVKTNGNTIVTVGFYPSMYALQQGHDIESSLPAIPIQICVLLSTSNPSCGIHGMF